MVDLERISTPSDAPGGAGATDQNARLVQMLRRGKWLILVLPMVFGVATWAYYSNRIPGFKVTPLFRASTKIQVDARIQDPLTGSQPLDARPGSVAKQQEKLFRSPLIMRPLAERQDIKDLRIFQNLGGKPVLAALFEGLAARSDPKTDQVAISFTSPSRRDSMAVADAAVEVFLEYHKERTRTNAMNAVALLEAERVKKLAAAEKLDAEIRALQKEHGIAGSELRNPLTTTHDALVESGQSALRQLASAEVELKRVEEAAKDPQTFLDYGTAMRNAQTNAVFEETISQHVRRRQELFNDRLALAKIRPEGHPDLLEIDKQRESLQAEIDGVFLMYAEQGLRAARDRVQEQRQKYEKFQEKVLEIEVEYFELEGILADLRSMKTEWSVLRGDINQFSERITELTVSGGAGGGNIHVVEPASAGRAPVFPETENYALIAAALGLALGVAFVLLRGFADRRIWTVEEVPNLLGTDVVGVFPELFTHKRQKVGRIVEEDPGSLAAEAIRSLRTSCSFGLPENGKGVVFVTSSVSGEGKSIVASNLAIALAQSGRRTLLLDADLRSPGQNEIFAVIGKRGFGDALAGDGEYEAGLVRSITAEGLDMLPAGDASQGAAELVEGGSSRELFARLRRDYDCIVVDSSPVLETAETRTLASLSDLVVFVMRMNVSTAPNGQRAVGILRNVGAELLGVMLNGARTRKGAKAYAGGLTYGYGYGYGYGQYKKVGDRQSEMQEVASRATPAPDSARFPAVGEAQGPG